MPLFKFKVSDRAGAIQEILVEGANQNDATRRVRSRQCVPIEYLGPSEATDGGRGFHLRMSNSKTFDVVDFTDRLVPLLQAQIPLERALGILQETTETVTEQELIGAMRRGLHEGRKFSQLVRDRGRLFPRMYASIVEAGEESGALPQVLGQLRDYLLMMREMRSFVISSSVYPAFVLAFSAIVLLVLMGVVVPKFAKVVFAIGGEPDLMTRIVLAISFGIRNYWWAGLLALAGLAALARMALQREDVRLWLDGFLLKVPLLGRMIVLANIGRQVRTMSILMRNGVHLLDTVAISAGVLQNSCMRDSIGSLAADLRRGERLSAALSRSEFVPPLVIRMLAVGEETGDTDVMLERVAERYDSELKQMVKRCLAWFEPLTIIFMGLVVGLIVFMLFMLVVRMQTAF